MTCPRISRIGPLLAVACIAAAAGCSRTHATRIAAPAIVPAAIAGRIMADADADHDGFLDRTELGRIPGLAVVAAGLDTDRDGRLSGAEIEAWFTRIRDSRVAIGSGGFRIVQKGKPLAGIAVRMVPEACMGGVIQAAEGVSDAAGFVSPGIQGGRRPGVHYGLYRLELTGKGAGGKPLPARFNTASQLGIGVGGLATANDTLTVELN
jgi:hypothetical protein